MAIAVLHFGLPSVVGSAGRDRRRASCSRCCSGIPTLRLRADYLAIVTIAAAEILRLITPVDLDDRFLRRHPRASPAIGGSFSPLTPFDNGRFYDFSGYVFSARTCGSIIVGWTSWCLSPDRWCSC